MIPIDPDKPLKVTDEKSGITYHFRVLTIEMQDEFDAICEVGKKAAAEKDPKASRRLDYEYKSRLVNMFLVFWENCPTPFPEKRPVAEMFPGGRINRVMSLIGENIGYLTGVTVEDIKN